MNYYNIISVQDRLEGSAYGPGVGDRWGREPRPIQATGNWLCSSAPRPARIPACALLLKHAFLRMIHSFVVPWDCSCRIESGSHPGRSYCAFGTDRSPAVVDDACGTHALILQRLHADNSLSKSTCCSVPCRWKSSDCTLGKCGSLRDRFFLSKVSCGTLPCTFESSIFYAFWLCPFPSRTHDKDA